ncbi:alpha/beta hydrolase family protein [Falsiroseomonas sp. HW251]|uniref:alpha/beta hydrolase family protein n=1 Tax=Falsiroseomonas sp. HW251 TaxID=3390998 RepID=UPI003D322670
MKIRVDETHAVSAMLQAPSDPVACLVLAHGAGAGMTHPFMTAVADGLVQRQIACLRFQFPYMEAGSRRPDRPPLAQAAVRAAVASAGELLASVPLFAGGKSFGGRMASQAQAEAALPGVRGLVFFGFPLHPAGKPSAERARHLAQVRVPMLFLQGTRDALAEPSLLAPVIAQLGRRATLLQVEEADHSFHVPARSGRSHADVLQHLLDRTAAWCRAVIQRGVS